MKVPKIVRETLMNPKTNQWSRKNIAAFVSLVFAFTYAYIGMICDKEVHEFVFLGALGLTGYNLGLSSWEKKHVTTVDSSVQDVITTTDEKK